MITIHDLLRAQEQTNKELQPVIEKFKEAKKQFEKESEEVGAPFYQMLEKYYDENLTDSNGNSVVVGDKFLIGKHQYEVVDRYMQTVLGTMMFNPRVICVKVGSASRNRRGKHIHPSELKQFTKL